MILDRIEADILLGSFDYARYFPKSKNLDRFSAHEARISNNNAGTPLFKDFTTLWYSENEIGWKHSYKETLKSSLDKHILPAFGECAISTIKKADILSFRANLGKLVRSSGVVGLSPARINHVMTPLRMILNEAADRFEFESPCKNIKPLRVPKTQVDPFSPRRSVADHQDCAQRL